MNTFKDKKAIFDRLEKVAAQANLSPEERLRFEEEWKTYNDYFNTIESAMRKSAAEGREEGRAEGRAEVIHEQARRMKDKGYPTSDIAEITGLPVEEIEKL